MPKANKLSNERRLRLGQRTFLFSGLSDREFDEHFRKIGETTTDSQEPLLSLEFQANGADFDLQVDGHPVAKAAPLNYLAQLTRSRLHAAVAYSHAELTFLRGDVVEVSPGKGVLLAGASFSGQTTLAQAFQSPLWSQHFAVLGVDGRALRYPDLNGESLSLLMVAKLTYQPGGSLAYRDLTAGPCALSLTSLLQGDEKVTARALPVLAKACSSAAIRLEGARGEASTTAIAMQELLNSSNL